MSDHKHNSDHPELTIKAGAWIGIAGIALTMILALFGAAGWIVSRIDRVENRIDRVETKITNGFKRYLPAAKHLDPLKSRDEQPTLAVPA